jgi:hypothetical protein
MGLSLARNSSLCAGCMRFGLTVTGAVRLLQVEASSVEPPAAAAEVVSEEAPGGKGV